ncbi:MAG: ATP-binding cassette domain-containing protein [Chloroflexota bacterium]
MAAPRGSITALVGPNGAGKSSLLRSFVGFEHPQQGVLRVLGHGVRAERAPALASVGYLAQDSQLYHGLTVARHVDLMEPPNGLRPRRRTVDTRVDAKTDPRGIVTTYEYDGLGSQTRVILNDVAGSSSEGDEDLSERTWYDTIGYVAATEDPRGTVTRHITDVLGRETKTIQQASVQIRVSAPQPRRRLRAAEHGTWMSSPRCRPHRRHMRQRDVLTPLALSLMTLRLI